MREFSPEHPKGLQEKRKTAQQMDWRELDAFGWEENANKEKAKEESINKIRFN